MAERQIHGRRAPRRRPNSGARLTALAKTVRALRQDLRVARDEAEVFRTIAETAEDSLFCKDRDRRYIYVSPAMAKLFGCEPEDLIGCTPEDLYDAKTAATVAQVDAIAFAGHVADVVREVVVNGVTMTLHAVQVPVHDGDGVVSRICGIVRDITERRRVENELDRYRADLEEMVAERTQKLAFVTAQLREQLAATRRMEKEILESTSHERARFGAELHDNLGQQLVAISCMAEALEGKLRDFGRAEAADAARMSALAREAIVQTRGIAEGLSPVNVEQEGLRAALRQLASRTRELFGVNCCYLGSASALVADNILATQLFYIAREAVANAVRHAAPSRITIHLVTNGVQGSLLVRDDGKGMAAGGVAGADGLGLQIMRYRADLIGAEVTWQSTRSGGTSVRCRFPARPAGSGTDV